MSEWESLSETGKKKTIASQSSEADVQSYKTPFFQSAEKSRFGRETLQRFSGDDNLTLRKFGNHSDG